MMGAATASALGFSVDANGDGKSLDVGSGATTTQSGNASNNPSLAVSVFGEASTEATGSATGNTLVAIDGRSAVGGTAEGNRVLTVAGDTELTGNSNGNTVVNVAGEVTQDGQGDKPGVQSLSVCGTEFSGQGQITVNPLQGGPC
jgi:hypothetical protein